MNILQNYSSVEIIGAFKKYASNRKLNDKYSIAYMVGMIQPTTLVSIFPDEYKRQELLDILFELLNEQTIYKFIQSEYVAKQLAKYL